MKKKKLGSTTRKHDVRPEKHNQYTNYTSLNKLKGDIFSVISSELPSPTKRKFTYRGRTDDNKYCKYHGDYSHHTDDCYQLKEEIEALIRRRRLKEYVVGKAVPIDAQAWNDTTRGIPGVHIYHIGWTHGGRQFEQGHKKLCTCLLTRGHRGYNYGNDRESIHPTLKGHRISRILPRRHDGCNLPPS
ncbi:unnamed protein product [Prunus armeniaca]